MSHSLQQIQFKCVHQTKSNNSTKQSKYSTAAFCYGGAQQGSLILPINHYVLFDTNFAPIKVLMRFAALVSNSFKDVSIHLYNYFGS